MKTEVQKAGPTPGDAHVNSPLTNVSVAWMATAPFIADKVFPVVPVQKQSDVYYVYSKDDFLRDEARDRAPGTESAGGTFGLTTDNYSCKPKAYHKDVDDQLRANADSVLSLDEAATRIVSQKMLIAREKQFVNGYFKTGVWGTDVTPSALWDVASFPRKDVDLGKVTIQQNTAGLVPNILVITPFVLNALRSNADVRDQFKYVSADSIDTAMLARYFGVEQVLVLGGAYNTAAQGATGAYSFYGGKHAMLVYSASTPSLMEPTAGYIFGWSGYVGSLNGVRIKRFRMEALESDRIEGQIALDMKKVAAECGYFLNGVVS